MRFAAGLPVLRQLCCNIDVLPIILCINHRINTNRSAVSIASAWLTVQSAQMMNADGKVYLNKNLKVLDLSMFLSRLNRFNLRVQ